jgi:hypothetical protein
MAAGAIPPLLFFGQCRPPSCSGWAFGNGVPEDTRFRENQQRRSRGSSGRRAYVTIKSEQHAKDI